MKQGFLKKINTPVNELHLARKGFFAMKTNKIRDTGRIIDEQVISVG